MSGCSVELRIAVDKPRPLGGYGSWAPKGRPGGGGGGLAFQAPSGLISSPLTQDCPGCLMLQGVSDFWSPLDIWIKFVHFFPGRAHPEVARRADFLLPLYFCVPSSLGLGPALPSWGGLTLSALAAGGWDTPTLLPAHSFFVLGIGAQRGGL